MFDISFFILGVAALLGITQGISEWLPISSKTQIMLISSILLGISFSEAYTLGLFLEVGTVIAAIVYFRREIWKVLLAIVGKGDEEGWLLLKYLVVVTLITAIIAVPIYLIISNLVAGSSFGIPMLILGALLIVDGLLVKYSKSRKTTAKKLEDLGLKDLFFLGIAQGISALPGISRSGATVSTLIFLKTKPDEAFRLSFFAGIPAVLGASAVTLIFSHSSVTSAVNLITIPGILIAAVLALIISLFLIRRLIKFAGTSRITSVVFILGAIAMASGIISILTGAAG
jgi:undecaprenyl-diphosphatase